MSVVWLFAVIIGSDSNGFLANVNQFNEAFAEISSISLLSVKPETALTLP